MIQPMTAHDALNELVTIASVLADHNQLELARNITDAVDVIDANTPDELAFSDGGRYENIFLGDEMIASYDTETGEFCVYDPDSDSEDPEFVL